MFDNKFEMMLIKYWGKFLWLSLWMRVWRLVVSKALLKSIKSKYCGFLFTTGILLCLSAFAWIFADYKNLHRSLIFASVDSPGLNPLWQGCSGVDFCRCYSILFNIVSSNILKITGRMAMCLIAPISGKLLFCFDRVIILATLR